MNMKIKMAMSETGFRLLEKGISPTLTIWEEEYATVRDFPVMVEKSNLVVIDEDLFEVKDVKGIELV